MLVPTETIRKKFLIVSKSKFQESFLAPLPLAVHTRVSIFVEGMRRKKLSIKRCEREGRRKVGTYSIKMVIDVWTHRGGPEAKSSIFD